jgi:hypothetical protein
VCGVKKKKKKKREKRHKQKSEKKEEKNAISLVPIKRFCRRKLGTSRRFGPSVRLAGSLETGIISKRALTGLKRASIFSVEVHAVRGLQRTRLRS